VLPAEGPLPSLNGDGGAYEEDGVDARSSSQSLADGQRE